MSIKCLMNGLEVNYPCSPSCALFGDCVTAFESQKKANVRTNADRIRAMSDEELAEFLWNFNLADVSTDKLGEFGPHMFRYRLKEWFKQPAEDDDHA